MYCIIEVLTTTTEDGEDQTLGRALGPFHELDRAKEAAVTVGRLTLHGHPDCKMCEVTREDLDGDDYFVHGYSIEDTDGNISALYMIKELEAVLIPELV